MYLFRTLSSIKAEPRNKLKHPGLHSTEPNTCSAVFCSQWPTAYSNFWYHTMGPGMAGEWAEIHCKKSIINDQWCEKMYNPEIIYWPNISLKRAKPPLWPLWSLWSLLQMPGVNSLELAYSSCEQTSTFCPFCLQMIGEVLRECTLLFIHQISHIMCQIKVNQSL